MNKTPLLLTAALLAATPVAKAVLGVGDVVSDPIVEQATLQKNIFDQLKYAWEQTQWADKLATLHSTLETVRQQLETANQVKQAIGDPVAAIGLIDNGVFSDYLQDSGIGDTLSELMDITKEGAELSSIIGQLFQPIDMSRWQNLSGDAANAFDGISSFRDAGDPLKRYRAVENAYTRFETVIGKAQNKRKLLNQQIARLTTQLKGAQDDAEVQKLAGSLTAAQSSLDDLDSISESSASQVQMLHVLNQNRKDEEEVAADEVSRKRNRELAQMAAQADAQIDLPDLSQPNTDIPPGF